MVELREQRLERAVDVGEVDDPAELRVDLAADVQRDLEAVAVQPRALVVGRTLGRRCAASMR